MLILLFYSGKKYLLSNVFVTKTDIYDQLIGCTQCDKKKIAKSLPNLPKNDFTGKIKDFDTSTKIA